MAQSFSTLTREQTNLALDLYSKVGNLDLYPRLNRQVKRSAASNAIASALKWSVVDLAVTVSSTPGFRDSVDGLINIFEAEHPDKVEESVLLANAMHEIETSGMTGVPTNQEESLLLVRELTTAGVLSPELLQQVEESMGANSDAPATKRPVGFTSSRLANDGTPDPVVNAEFDALIKGMDNGPDKPRFIVDSDGETETGA